MAMTDLLLRSLRLKRQNKMMSQGSIEQVEHVRSAGARLVTLGVLVPGDVLAPDVTAAGVQVDVGTILRIQAAADVYVAFGSSTAMAAVDVNTTPALKLGAGYHLVIATDNFVRASAAFTRLEVVKE